MIQEDTNNSEALRRLTARVGATYHPENPIECWVIRI